MKHHHSNPHPHKPSANLDHFYVITVISNPKRYKRRYELYWHFKEMVEDAGVKLITVEQAFGHRPFMVTDPSNPFHVQVRTIEELWHKENMINLGTHRARQIDPKAREVAWVDADCFPVTPAINWFEETWHALQHYEFVQMWEYLINFGPQNQPVSGPQMSFMKTYAANGHEVPIGKTVKQTTLGIGWEPQAKDYGQMIGLGRPGLAWAANIDALDKVGGLIDFCIVGSGDWHMAHGLVGAMNQGGWEFKMSRYAEKLLEWQIKAERWIKRDVGYVPVTVGHSWHGNKEDRQYGTRGGILVGNGFNPDTDVKYDSYGLLQLETHEPRQIKMRDQIRSYFGARNEDSIDVLS